MIDHLRSANTPYKIVDLTQPFAVEHASALAGLANLIPEVHYTEQDILAETKGDRRLYAKWLHGLVAIDSDTAPIAFIGAYERASEQNEQYPENTLYISELAVSESYQRKGIARELVEAFLEKNTALGLVALRGELNYSIQTNAAAWNTHVVDFYRSFGFADRAVKEYPDRSDVILGLKKGALS